MANEETVRTILEYRGVIDEAYEVKDNCEPGTESVNKINNILDHAERLAPRVDNVGKAILDARVLNISSDVLKQNAEYLNTNLMSYDVNKFAKHLVGFLGEDQLTTDGAVKWEKLAPFAKKCFKYRTPSFVFMNGTFQVGDVAPPEKKARKQREKDVEGNKKNPTNVKQGQKEEDAVEETVNCIMKTLLSAWRKNKQQPISYFKLVINPDSFGATVENIFHVAFLVKDGHVDFKLDDNKMPVIVQVPKQVFDMRKQTEPERQQRIASINKQEWRAIIDALDIKTPMIKPQKTGSRQ